MMKRKTVKVIKVIFLCNPLGVLIFDVREFLAREWSCTCQHTFREDNFSADIMSKLGCDLEEEFEVFKIPT
ncbi:hypothetical protein CCACVL1_07540 [Corchorus capsularis]|uniref:RNase H type-1 domain-containing protein n=1 Tax=Corchorus capsularis TaxID=210143 RepID=A0A1R3J5C0_COCAP|nr:hypothetical protein CCACVL1_07540 [Corchorus capsularis]